MKCNISVRKGDSPEDIHGKVIYADPVEALIAMMSINRLTGSLDGRTSRELLHGMYRCGHHVHLTRQKGDRQLLAQAVTDLIDQAVRAWREGLGALDVDGELA